MNKIYNIYPARETEVSSPGVYSPAVNGINPLGNDSQGRMCAIIPRLMEWELGVF